MKTQPELVRDFRDGATHGSASHMYITDNILFSYGVHFPLCIRFSKPDGYKFLINGDYYSHTTACHQRLVLDLGCQIPFSALNSALIDVNKIEILDFREDEWHQVPDPLPEDPGHVREEHTLGAVLLEFREKCYLSSLDENEHWRLRSYFLSELPKKVLTIDDAYDSLVPDRVKEWRADDGNPSDLRQGDWFFLPTDIETRKLKRPTYRNAQLLDTSHYVTELRKDGDLYSRGTVRHRPPYRRSQHRMLSLGDAWHITLRNLAVESWNAVGGVD